MADFRKIMTLAELPLGSARRIEIEGLTIALVHCEDGVFAVDDLCTHAEASLSDGLLDGCELECPLHAARFDVRNGQVTAPPAFEDLQTYKVRVLDDGTVEIFF